jgi:hypothetical protein
LFEAVKPYGHKGPKPMSRARVVSTAAMMAGRAITGTSLRKFDYGGPGARDALI